jgi:hypothetical protein
MKLLEAYVSREAVQAYNESIAYIGLDILRETADQNSWAYKIYPSEKGFVIVAYDTPEELKAGEAGR